MQPNRLERTAPARDDLVGSQAPQKTQQCRVGEGAWACTVRFVKIRVNPWIQPLGMPPAWALQGAPKWASAIDRGCAGRNRTEVDTAWHAACPTSISP